MLANRVKNDETIIGENFMILLRLGPLVSESDEYLKNKIKIHNYFETMRKSNELHAC